MIPALIRQIRHEADDVVSLLIEPTDGGALPAWEAGAHVEVAVVTRGCPPQFDAAQSDRVRGQRIVNRFHGRLIDQSERVGGRLDPGIGAPLE